MSLGVEIGYFYNMKINSNKKVKIIDNPNIRIVQL